MGHGEGVGPEVRHLGDTQRRGELADRPGEPVPGHVGLGTAEQQEVAAGAVAAGGEGEPVPVEHGVEAVAELHDRASGPEVDEDVVVELGDRRRVGLVGDGVDRRTGGGTGVDPTGEHDDQHGFVQRRRRDQPAHARVGHARRVPAGRGRRLTGPVDRCR